MKILIVKLSAFGDLIHALPALDDLLARPEVEEVHWLVDERYAFVTEAFPPQVVIHRVALKGAHPLRSAWRAIRRLRALRFDAVLDMQGLIKSGILARMAGAPVYGIDAAFVREGLNSWFVQPGRFHAGERHVVQQCRRIATAPFVSNPERMPEQAMDYRPPHIPMTSAIRDAGHETVSALGLDAHRYVVLHVGGGWVTKQLPTGTWRELIRALIEAELVPLICWGTKAEFGQAQALCEDEAGCRILPRRLHMLPLCGLLNQARAVVGADTGIVHLAAALSAPTVSFWGPSASWRSAPMGPEDVHIESSPDCGPCFKRQCDHFICMDRIRAKDIMEAIHA